MKPIKVKAIYKAIKELVRLCKCLTRYQSIVSHLPYGTNGAQAVILECVQIIHLPK